jgi:hypothetical protein
LDRRDWPWEGQVQALFARFLQENGWLLTAAMADTARKGTGVDVLAQKGARQLGAEVKGRPGKYYADVRRVAETKPTQPGTQAGHWYSEAVVKAMMLLDTHPGHESLVVLPDYPRYRDLAARTRTGRGRAGIHVVYVSEDGSAGGDTWEP